jgi:hypothetical protein
MAGRVSPRSPHDQHPAHAYSRSPRLRAIAPSLPALTREEEAKLDAIVDRLIRADIGQLRGEGARKALKEFDALKAEAVPALIRGLNKSAKLNHSCPVLLISKKLTSLLMASNDQILLEFARDEIGADVGRSRYSSALQDLRFKCLMRKNALARLSPPPPKPPAVLTTAQLAKLASAERGGRLKGLLTELAKRTGKEVLPALAATAVSDDRDTKKLGQEFLDDHLGRQSASQVIERLDDDAVEVRKSAVRVLAGKHADYLDKVIDRLTDESAEVRGEARAALVKRSKTEDFGAEAKATRAEQREAQKKWRAWWKAEQEKR